MFPGLAKLTPRQIDALGVNDITRFPEDTPRAIDLSQSDKFAKCQDAGTSLAMAVDGSMDSCLNTIALHMARSVVGVARVKLNTLSFMSQAKHSMLKSVQHKSTRNHPNLNLNPLPTALVANH